MQINITIHGDEDPYKLNALAALIAALGGRVPAVSIANTVHVDRSPTITDRDGALPPESESLADDHSDEDTDIVDAAVAAGAPQHDSAGVPWDERIHASSRATIGDGTWRRRKNTPDDLYESVMAELRGPNEPTADAVPAPPATSSAEPVSADVPNAPSVATATPAVAAEPVADDTPAPPAAIDLSSFAKFVSAVNSKDVPAERKVYAALNELAQGTFGVPAFKDMLHKPNDWQMFYDMVG